MSKEDINDASRLDIRDGTIHFRVYQQNGYLQPMECADTPHNRRFVSWLQVHDSKGEPRPGDVENEP